MDSAGRAAPASPGCTFASAGSDGTDADVRGHRGSRAIAADRAASAATGSGVARLANDTPDIPRRSRVGRLLASDRSARARRRDRARAPASTDRARASFSATAARTGRQRAEVAHSRAPRRVGSVADTCASPSETLTRRSRSSRFWPTGVPRSVAARFARRRRHRSGHPDSVPMSMSRLIASTGGGGGFAGVLGVFARGAGASFGSVRRRLRARRAGRRLRARRGRRLRARGRGRRRRDFVRGAPVGVFVRAGASASGCVSAVGDFARGVEMKRWLSSAGLGPGTRGLDRADRRLDARRLRPRRPLEPHDDLLAAPADLHARAALADVDLGRVGHAVAASAPSPRAASRAAATSADPASAAAP